MVAGSVRSDAERRRGARGGGGVGGSLGVGGSGGAGRGDDRRELPLAVRAEGAGVSRSEGARVPDRSDHSVLRERGVRAHQPGAAGSGADRRGGRALGLDGDLRVPGGAAPGPAAAAGGAGGAGARALARGVRGHADGRGVHLAAVQRGGDQAVRLGGEDGRGGGAARARRGDPLGARATSSASFPRRASCSARSELRTSRWPRSSGTRSSRGSRWTPSAGRGWPRSSRARSRTRASRSCARSRSG